MVESAKGGRWKNIRGGRQEGGGTLRISLHIFEYIIKITPVPVEGKKETWQRVWGGVMEGWKCNYAITVFEDTEHTLAWLWLISIHIELSWSAPRGCGHWCLIHSSAQGGLKVCIASLNPHPRLPSLPVSAHIYICTYNPRWSVRRCKCGNVSAFSRQDTNNISIIMNSLFIIVWMLISDIILLCVYDLVTSSGEVTDCN